MPRWNLFPARRRQRKNRLARRLQQAGSRPRRKSHHALLLLLFFLLASRRTERSPEERRRARVQKRLKEYLAASQGGKLRLRRCPRFPMPRWNLFPARRRQKRNRLARRLQQAGSRPRRSGSHTPLPFSRLTVRLTGAMPAGRRRARIKRAFNGSPVRRWRARSLRQKQSGPLPLTFPGPNGTFRAALIKAARGEANSDPTPSPSAAGSGPNLRRRRGSVGRASRMRRPRSR